MKKRKMKFRHYKGRRLNRRAPYRLSRNDKQFRKRLR